MALAPACPTRFVAARARTRGRARRPRLARREHSLKARGLVGALVSGLVVVGAPAIARADQGSIFFGNEAALRAGAINAMVRDGSAAWYNPAGLSAIKATNLDVSLNLYGLRLRRVPDGHLLRFPDGDVGGDYRHLDVYVIPSAVVFSKRFRPGLVGGVSVFVTESNSFSFQTEFHGVPHSIASGADAGDWQTDHVLDMQVNSRTYAVGPSLGWIVTPKVRLGLSLHGIYRYGESSYQLWSHSAQQTEDGAGGSHVLAQSRLRDLDTQLGVMLTFGLQASPTERFNFGFTIRSPQLVLISWPGISLTESRAYTNEAGVTDVINTNFPERDATLRGDFDILANVRVDAGFAYHWDKVSWSGDLNLRPRNPTSFFSRRFATTTFSARMGFLVPLGDLVTLGTGVYMDRSGAEAGPFSQPFLGKGDGKDFSSVDAPELFVEDVDFYGLTLGVRLERRLWRRLMEGPKGWKELAEGEWSKQKEDIYASKVSLTTTIGLRYALGHGTVTGTAYEFGRDPATIEPERAISNTVPLTLRALEVFSHDFTLYLGTQLTF
ncbi:MAG: hypothetical protein H6713_32795 [Myxococcales bacterium]|nr:hypothetical protein [Myxococcales bacterium]